MRKSRRFHRSVNSRKNPSSPVRLDYDHLEVRHLLAGDVLPGATDLVNLTQPVPLSQSQQLLRSHLNLAENETMQLIKMTEDKLGQQHFKYQQMLNGTKVENGIYTLHTNGSEIIRLSGEYQAVNDPIQGTRISNAAALRRAMDYVGATQYAWQDVDFANQMGIDLNPTGEMVFIPDATGPAVLTYKFDIYALEPFTREYVYVNASTGEIVQAINRIKGADTPATGTSLYNGSVSFTADSFNGDTQYRLRQAAQGVETYDLQGQSDPGAAVDIVNSTTDFTDPALHKGVSAHFAAESTYRYFLETYGRDSYDDAGSTLLSYVSHPIGVNAFWDGTAMYYGDGDGVNYGPLVSLDIGGHEIGHGITEYSANLVYQNEPGALNESYSDIFGELVENYGSGGNDWLLGDDIGIGGSGAIRSMQDPNLFQNPDTYLGDFWQTGPGDSGGVHTNSGVQNKWFFLLTDGEAGTNDNGEAYNVTGIGINDAAAIAYRNLTVYLAVNSQYQDARDGAVQAAIDLFGRGSQQHISTNLAWRAVGVYGAELEIFEVDKVSNGTGIYEAKISDDISAGETDEITIGLDGNQTLTVVVNGNEGLTPQIEVRNSGGTLLKTGTTYGSTGIVQVARVATADVYTIFVSGANGTFGTYDVDVTLNAAVELESHSNISNGSQANAQNLDESAISFGTGIDRLGVVGAFTIDEAPLHASENFESGAFGSTWSNVSSTKTGRIRVNGDFGTAAGSFALMMDTTRVGRNNLNESVWTANLAGLASPVLSFWHAEWNDETTALPPSFNNSRAGDGVSVSPNGTTWYTVLTDTETPLGQWDKFAINLGDVAAQNNFALGANFKIKFQQYDDGPLQDDGRGYDEIVINEAGIVDDWYAFTLNANQYATISATALDVAGQMSFSVYDSAGVLVQNSSSLNSTSESYVSQIKNANNAPRTFYVKTSGEGTRYSLVVTRGADFQTTASEATPQDISNVSNVFGSVESVVAAAAEPDQFTTGSVVNTAYPGVTLSNGVTGGSVYAVAVSYTPPTGSKIFSPAPTNVFGWREGSSELRADFDVLQSSVSIDVGSNDASGDVSFLRAYNIYDELLAESRSTPLLTGKSQTLTIDWFRAEIAYVTAAGSGNDVTPLDNLVYEVDSNEADVYSFFVEGPITIKIGAALPGAGSLLFNNKLVGPNGSMLKLELLGSNGNVLAVGTDSISYFTKKGGAFKLRVSTDLGSGEYFVFTNTNNSNKSLNLAAAKKNSLVIGDKVFATELSYFDV